MVSLTRITGTPASLALTMAGMRACESEADRMMTSAFDTSAFSTIWICRSTSVSFSGDWKLSSMPLAAAYSSAPFFMSIQNSSVMALTM